MNAKKLLVANFAPTKLQNLVIITSMKAMPFLPIIIMMLIKMFRHDVEPCLHAEMFPK